MFSIFPQKFKNNKTTHLHNNRLICIHSHGTKINNDQNNALHACVYIYTRLLSSFRAPTLWFVNLTVATCHIQYTFLSLCQFFSRQNGQNTKILVSYQNGRRQLLGAQSITFSFVWSSQKICQTRRTRKQTVGHCSL